MNAQLNHLLAEKRTAELHQAGDQARLAREVRMRVRRSRDRNPIMRLMARPARALGLLVVPVALALLALSAPPVRADPLGFVTEFSTGLAAGSDPEWITAGADGNLWFTDEGTTPAIGRITPSGQITEFSAGLNPGAEPAGITAGPDGNLWFTDPGTHAIGQITPSGQITEFSSPEYPSMDPQQIATGPDGNLWFTDQGTTAAIGRITPSGQITEFSTGLNLGGFNSVLVGIAAGPDGNVWFTDEGTDAIGQITPSGQITEFSNPQNPDFNPVEITAGPDGNLWFTDQGYPDSIGRITPSGQITEFTDPQNPDFDPERIVAGPDGNMWFADWGDNRAIGQITPSGQITETGLAPYTYPVGITVGPDGNLWFADAGGAIGRIGSGAPPALGAPASVSGAGRPGKRRGLRYAVVHLGGLRPIRLALPVRRLHVVARREPDRGSDRVDLHPDGRRRRPPARLPGDRHLPAPVFGHRDRHQCRDHRPVRAAPPAPSLPPNPDAGALGAGHHPPDVHAPRAPGRGPVSGPEPFHRGDRPCIRRVALSVRFTLSVGATVTFAVERELPGRLTRGRCAAPARSDRRHRPCTRPVMCAARP